MNHRMNFGDPQTGAHTQTSRASGAVSKERLSRTVCTSNNCCNNYLQEFLWQQEFGERPRVLFFTNF